MLLRGLRQLLGRPSPSTARQERARLLPEGGFPLLLEKRQRQYAEYVRSGDNEVRNLLGDSYDADVSLAPESARYKVSLMEKVLLRIGSVADSRDVPVVFVIIPSGFDECDGWEERVDADARPVQTASTTAALVPNP